MYFIFIKKTYIYAMIGSSGRDCVLIISFQFYRSKAGFLKIIYYGWVNMPLPLPNLRIGRRTNRILINFA